MNNKVVLFLNGEKPNKIPDLSIYDQVFCIDGAYAYLKELNIVPNVISGDFDSINLESIPNEIQLIHTPDQNYTDFDKALNIITNFNHKNVDIFGASGQQQDHFLGNLTVASKYKSRLNLVFIDNYSSYRFIPNNYTLNNVFGKTISLFPFPSAYGITTKGLEYPLTNESLELTKRIGTRNKAIANEISINYTSGELILFVIN